MTPCDPWCCLRLVHMGQMVAQLLAIVYSSLSDRSCSNDRLLLNRHAGKPASDQCWKPMVASADQCVLAGGIATHRLASTATSFSCWVEWKKPTVYLALAPSCKHQSLIDSTSEGETPGNKPVGMLWDYAVRVFVVVGAQYTLRLWCLIPDYCFLTRWKSHSQTALWRDE